MAGPMTAENQSDTAPATAGAGPDAVVVSLRDVGYTYPGGVEATAHLDLDLHSDEILSVIGPSGCGKSTLLRLVSGLAEPTAGSVRTDLPRTPDRHQLSMLFQQDTLLPWMSVEDNVGLYFRLHRRQFSTKDINERVGRLLDMVGLSDFAKAYPKHLSGGMRRRVALLAAVAPWPQVLLLDEPFSAVDEPTRIGIHQDVLQIVRELHIATILVTHDLAEAITVADRVALLSFRPARVVRTFDTGFGRDRDVRSLRVLDSYSQLYAQVWEGLNEQSAAGRPTGRHATD
jgi:ABC-type nitrate/sulfonate/bicarbonate transport system ATPase subunit